MKIAKMKLVVYVLLAVIIPVSVFIMHEKILYDVEPFGGNEIKQDGWWIEDYNEYYITSSIMVSFLILCCVYISTYTDLRIPNKGDYLTVAMCAWLILLNILILFFPFLPCIANLISFCVISVICMRLILCSEKRKHIKAFLVWALMLLTGINNIWCMNGYFSLYGD